MKILKPAPDPPGPNWTGEYVCEYCEALLGLAVEDVIDAYSGVLNCMGLNVGPRELAVGHQMYFSTPCCRNTIEVNVPWGVRILAAEAAHSLMSLAKDLEKSSDDLSN